MEFNFFFTFVFSLAKAGLWISIGILVSKHMDTLLSLIIRRPLPEGLIKPEKLNSAKKVIKWIGIFTIIFGFGVALSGLATFVVRILSTLLNF